MFQLFLLAAVVYILSRWLRRDNAAPRRTRSAPPTPPAGQVEEMVQDPACGTWVPLSQALAARRGRETLHFCSAECRDKYMNTDEQS